MYFASAEPAVREGTLAGQASVLFMLCLFLLCLYIAVRAALTNPAKQSSAPQHVRHANSMLKWIALAAPVVAVWGALFEVFQIVNEAGIEGGDAVDLGFYAAFGAFVIFLILGLSVSLLALLGMAVLFFKKIRYERSLEHLG